MGPVRQNPIQRIVSLFICVCIALCTTVAHNIAQNRPDSVPPYPPDNHHCSDDVYLREGSETWPVKKENESTLQSTMIRWTSCIQVTDRFLRNTEQWQSAVRHND